MLTAASSGCDVDPGEVDDLARWRNVAGYRDLVARTGSDFAYVTIALRRATPALDGLAEQLPGRWLYLTAGVAALASPQAAA